MSLERRPVCSAQQPREIKAANPEGMDEHANNREVNRVSKKHEPDSKYYRQHRGLISVGTLLYRNTSCDSHRELVSKATPRSCDCDQPFSKRVLSLAGADLLRER